MTVEVLPKGFLMTFDTRHQLHDVQLLGTQRIADLFEIRDGTMVLEADIQREVALATCQREDTGIEQRRLSNTTSTIDDSLVALQDVTRQRFYLLCAAIKRLPFCVGHKTQPRIAVGTHSILY